MSEKLKSGWVRNADGSLMSRGLAVGIPMKRLGDSLTFHPVTLWDFSFMKVDERSL